MFRPIGVALRLSVLVNKNLNVGQRGCVLHKKYKNKRFWCILVLVFNKNIISRLLKSKVKLTTVRFRITNYNFKRVTNDNKFYTKIELFKILSHLI